MTLPSSLQPLLESLARYPDWLIVAGLTVVAAALIWVVAKLLKWSLYLLMVLVLIGGAAATVWLLLDLVW